jgi:hypothetical protein
MPNEKAKRLLLLVDAESKQEVEALHWAEECIKELEELFSRKVVCGDEISLLCWSLYDETYHLQENYGYGESHQMKIDALNKLLGINIKIGENAIIQQRGYGYSRLDMAVQILDTDFVDLLRKS